VQAIGRVTPLDYHTVIYILDVCGPPGFDFSSSLISDFLHFYSYLEILNPPCFLKLFDPTF
jgi:hypothetical protein